MCLAPLLTAQEICDNGIDDDANGLVDLNDLVGCPCQLAPDPVNVVVNGSFEDNSCCPEGYAEFACVDGWSTYYVAATPDYFNCDFLPTNVPQPIPDGNGYAGMGAFTDWSHTTSHYEFMMNCLSTPLTAGLDHELSFHIAADRVVIAQQFPWMIPSTPLNMGPIDMVVYGFASCPSSPYVIIEPVFGIPEPAVYCPTEFGWTPLGSVTYTPATTWEELSIAFNAPFDVAAIMLGPACPIPADYISYQTTWPYFFLDDISLEPVVVGIERTGHPCTNDLLLSAINHFPQTNSYQWFHDGIALAGQTGATLDASALGLGAGIYTIRSIDPAGNCTMAQATVDVTFPTPLLQAVPAQGCAPLEVTLSNTTDPDLTASQAWDLGPGGTHTTATVTHTYSDPGSYDVLLTVTSPEGCVKDSLFEDLITVHPLPLVSFTADTLSGCIGLEVLFTNTSTVAGVPQCTWDFGDGNSSTDCTVQHTYTSPGHFDVTLEVTSGDGCTSVLTQPQLITVMPTPDPAMTYHPASGCIPLEVRFSNQTPDLAHQTAYWDLGNGSTSTEVDPEATYTTPGQFTVSLTMTNELGCSATITETDAITAYGLPLVTFSVEPDSGCAPLPVAFSNTTDPGMIGSCTWAFGDGEQSAECATEHIYRDAGDYTVSLTVTSPAGCDGDTTIHHLVHVDPKPTANFAFNPMDADLFNTAIDFQDLSSPDVVEWHWDLPPAEPSTASEPAFQAIYPPMEKGAYAVQLVVTNIFGCQDTAIRVITIDGVFSVFVPSAFTPDEDGVNDVFLPVLRDHVPKDYVLRVFDRWGTEIFTSTDPDAGWNGTVQGEPPVTGIYAWQLRARSEVDRIMRQYTGHVTLLR